MKDLCPEAFLPRTLRRELARAPAAGDWELSGATLFADVSGFTPLAEALGRLGRAGAEVLTATLNGYFEPIVAGIEARGGDVMRFAGDAVTAFFADPDGEERAIGAAHAIQHAMAERPTVESPAGRFAIRIKVGIAVGMHRLLVVGSAGCRDYVFGGAPVDAAAEAEHAAEAGQIVLHASCRRARRVTAAIPLARCAAPPPLAASLHDGERIDCRSFLHPALVERLESGRLELLNESRRVAVLFVSFVAAGGVGEFYRAARQRVDDYGGYLNKIDLGDKGAKLLITFGAPIAHEDDADRAVHLAEDLLALGEEGGHRVAIGVDAGTIFAGLIGGPTRCEYTVMGDHVNLAARLMQLASTGQVVVSEAVRRSAASYGYRPLPPARVKGKRDLVAVYQPTERGGGTREGAEFFVGRRRELETAVRFLGQAQGRPALLTLTGPAGIGKTACWREIERSLGDARVVVAACQSFASTLPHQPWRRALRRVVELLPGDAPPAEPWRQRLAAQAPELLPFAGLLLDWIDGGHGRDTPELASELRQNLLERSIRLALGEAARSAPLILVVADLHWADADSVALLERLLRTLEAPAPAFVVTSRQRPNQLIDIVDTQELELSPLGPEEIAAFLGRALGSERLPGPLLEAAAAGSQGNPFLLEATLRAFLESGYVSRSVESPDVLFLDELRRPTIAASLEDVVMARFDRLAPAQQALLKALSVFGAELEPEACADWLDQNRIDRAVLDAVLRDTDFLTRDPAGGIRFALDPARTAIESSLDAPSRRRLHLQAARIRARWAAADDPLRAARLARHFFEAEAYREGLEAMLAAASDAYRQFALPQALRYLRALLRQPGLLLGERLAEAAFVAGDALLQLGRFDEVTGLLGPGLLEALGTGDERGRLRRLRGDALRRLGRFAEAEAELLEAEREAVSDLDRFRARALRGTLLAQQNRLNEAAEHFAALDRDFRDAVSAVEVARTATTRGGLLCLLGKRAEGLRLMIAAKAELLDGSDVLSALKLLHNLGSFQGLAGDHPLAYATFAESRSIQEKYGVTQHLGVTLNELGYEAMLLGHWPEAAHELRRALDLSRRFGDDFESKVLLNLSELSRCAGDFAASRRHLAASAAARGAARHAHEILFYWIELLADLPYPAALMRMLDRLQRRIERNHLSFLRYLHYGYLAHALVLQGNRKGARLLAAESYRRATEADLKKEAYLALRAQILASDEGDGFGDKLRELGELAAATHLRQFQLEAITLELRHAPAAGDAAERGDRLLAETPFANLAWRFELAAADAEADRERRRARLASARAFFEHVREHLPWRGARRAFAAQAEARALADRLAAEPDLPPGSLPEALRSALAAASPVTADRSVTADVGGG